MEKVYLKRKNISRGYCKKFNEMFLYGLKKFELGVQLVFHPNVLGSTNITKDQIIRYFFNKEIGLGKKFLYNKRGKHAFANKVSALNREELVVLLRLLVMPNSNQIRTYNGWIDIGISQAPVRVLIASRDKVYFLYKINEHRDYQAQLLVSPDKVTFAAA